MKKTTAFVVTVLMISFLSGCFRPPVEPIEEPTPTTGQRETTGVIQEPTEQPSTALPTEANLRYVIYEDGGATGEMIGCNDSIVPVVVSLPPYSSWAEIIDHLYMGLIHADGQTGVLETAIPDTLVVDEAVVTGGTATISLSGTLMIEGVCDHPRIQEQLTRIALQFPEITTVEILINGVTLENYLSLK